MSVTVVRPLGAQPSAPTESSGRPPYLRSKAPNPALRPNPPPPPQSKANLNASVPHNEFPTHTFPAQKPLIPNPSMQMPGANVRDVKEVHKGEDPRSLAKSAANKAQDSKPKILPKHPIPPPPSAPPVSSQPAPRPPLPQKNEWKNSSDLNQPRGLRAEDFIQSMYPAPMMMPFTDMFPPAPAPPAAPASNVEAVKVETKPPAPAVKPPEAPKLAIPPMKYEPEDKEVSSDEEVKPRRRKKPVPAYPFPRLPTQPMPGYTPRAAMPDDAIRTQRRQVDYAPVVRPPTPDLETKRPPTFSDTSPTKPPYLPYSPNGKPSDSPLVDALRASSDNSRSASISLISRSASPRPYRLVGSVARPTSFVPLGSVPSSTMPPPQPSLISGSRNSQIRMSKGRPPFLPPIYPPLLDLYDDFTIFNKLIPPPTTVATESDSEPWEHIESAEEFESGAINRQNHGQEYQLNLPPHLRAAIQESHWSRLVPPENNSLSYSNRQVDITSQEQDESETAETFFGETCTNLPSNSNEAVAHVPSALPTELFPDDANNRLSEVNNGYDPHFDEILDFIPNSAIPPYSNISTPLEALTAQNSGTITPDEMQPINAMNDMVNISSEPRTLRCYHMNGNLKRNHTSLERIQLELVQVQGEIHQLKLQNAHSELLQSTSFSWSNEENLENWEAFPIQNSD